MLQTIQYPAFVKLDLLHPNRGLGFDQQNPFVYRCCPRMPCEMFPHDIGPALDGAIRPQRLVQLELGEYIRKNIADA